MYQIGIVGKPTRKRFQIVNQLEGSQTFRVRLFSDMQEAKKYLKGEFLSGLILIEETLEDDLIETMDEIIHENQDLAVLCVLSSLTLEQKNDFLTYNIQGASLLDFNRELEDLKGVVRRMLSGDRPVLRSHYRHSVSTRATLISERSRSIQRIQLVDLSKGGLQARLLDVKQLKKGDRVQIQVPFEQKNGHHLVIGRVAWINESGYMGVQFDQVTAKVQTDDSRAAA